MALVNLFNKIYHKGKIEELDYACHRLNALIQLKALRAGQKKFIDRKQGVKRPPMSPEVSYELDRKIVEKSNEIIKSLMHRSSNWNSPSMQKIIHFELMALEEFKQQLYEKRSRKLKLKSSKVSFESHRLSRKPTKEVEVPKQLAKVLGEPKEPLTKSQVSQTIREIKEAEILREECKDDLPDDGLLATDCDQAVQLKLEDLKTKLDEHTDSEEDECTCEETESENIVETPVSSERASISEPTSLESRLDLEEEVGISCAQPETSLVKPSPCTGCTLREAMKVVKQNCSDYEIVVLVSPLRGKPLHASSVLQITLFNKFKRRVLGSFQIPSQKLGALEEEGILKVYPAIFLSRSISTVHCNIDMVVDQLPQLPQLPLLPQPPQVSRIHSDCEDIDRLFGLAENHGYQIYARPDYGSGDSVYVCDFYTATNMYIGTTRLLGVDVLEQLQKRPRVVKNFEMVVELNDQVLPKKLKEVVDDVLKRLNLTKLYETVGLVLFKIFR